MAYTVVGLFDSKTEARAAMNELVKNGFVTEDIDISEATTGSSTGTSTGSTTGTGSSVGNFFNHLFGDDQTKARNYTNVAQDADAILTVHVNSQDRANRVAEIFDRHGAVDLDDRSSQYQQNFSQTSQTSQTRETTQDRTATHGDQSIPIIEESLQVGKRTVEQGGVRVRSRIVEKPVEETLRLREERVVVNRHAVNRAATEADLRNIQDGEIEITERSEVPVVSKHARVVEEVSVGKQVEERDQVVTDTVRRTEVEVDEINTNDTTRRAGNKN